MPARVISGFHMMKKTPYTEEEKSLILETAKELAEYETVFIQDIVPETRPLP